MVRGYNELIFGSFYDFPSSVELLLMIMNLHIPCDDRPMSKL